jgi:glucose/arabinose dehydrogenase
MRTRTALASAVLAATLAASGGALATAAAAGERAAGPSKPAAGGLAVGIQALGDFDFSRPEVVSAGLEVPWGLAFLPDGAALVAERNSGRVSRLRPGAAAQQVAQVSGVVAAGESGLLGLAVSPTYAQDGFVYAYLTTATDNRIVRFTLAAPANQQPILTGLAKASIHDGGRIAFGPDGMLYAGVGDASVTGNAQDPQSRNGKILRLRPDGTVPADNPFAGSPVYSLGHRNVQGLAWDAQGRLYASEFGQNTWDEVNRIVAGGNYGWPTVEGTSGDTRFRNPIVTWTTAEASPSGAAIVGNRLFVAALRGTRLWTVPLTGDGGAGTPAAQLQGTFGRLRTVALGPDGFLWVSTSNRDGRGTPASTDDRILRFPPAGGTPTPTGSPAPTASTAPPTQATCAVRYDVNEWNGGFTANVTVTNRGPAVTGWTLGWAFAGDQRIANAWNARVTQSGQSVTAADAGWNAALATGGSATFGFQATFSGSNGRPAQFRLNGATCSAG